MSFKISRAASEGQWGSFVTQGQEWVARNFTIDAQQSHVERRGLNSWKTWGLSPRLAEVAQLVPPGLGVIDVGTDHALLPLALTRSQHSPAALGVDINQAPLQGAYARFSSHDLVDLVLADGFVGSAQESEALWTKLGAPTQGLCGCVCGVGGAKIATMIPTIPSWIQHLVLQANTHHERVRQSLRQAGWSLTEERLTVEGNRIFLTVAACRSKSLNYQDDNPLKSHGDHLISHETWYPLWLWVHLEKELELISKAVEHCSQQAKQHFDERRFEASKLATLLKNYFSTHQEYVHLYHSH